MPRLLLFDIDLTLIRSNGAGRSSIDAAFADCFGIQHATQGVSFDGRTDQGIFDGVMHHFELDGDGGHERLDRVFARYLLELPSHLRARHGVVLPGVPQLLDRLSAEHVPLGLATGNIRPGAEIKLTFFGIWDHFLTGGFGDDSAVRSEIVTAGIHRLAALAGVEPEPASVLVIGDTPLDVQAAHLAGAKAVGVASGNYGTAELRASGADFVLKSFADTEASLRVLLG